MFEWLYNLLGTVLSFFDGLTGSYAIALLFYALIFKIVFLPFSIKQQRNQIKMAKLAPKIALIKAKYKGRTDQPTLQKQQQEIMELQRQEGYSPLSGCLPLLIQLPLIILLYTVIQNPLSYIAKTTDAFDNYNDNKIVEGLSPAMQERYNKLIAEGKDITKNDIVLELCREFYLGAFGEEPTEPIESDYTENGILNAEKFNKAKEDYQKAQAEFDKKVNETTEIARGKEITLIGKINNFIKDGNEEKYPNTTKEERMDIISSFGIDYKTYPNFDIFGANMALTPSFKEPSIILAIPFLTAIAQWLSMFLTRKLTGNAQMQMQGQDAQGKGSMLIMDLMMPAMTLWMAFSFSAMLGLYWIFQSLLGLVQQFILTKAMPLPKYTEEEIKEMHKQQKEAEKAGRAAVKAQPKHKSLHYIDEDDYDELPATPTNESGKSTKISSDIPEIKD